MLVFLCGRLQEEHGRSKFHGQVGAWRLSGLLDVADDPMQGIGQLAGAGPHRFHAVDHAGDLLGQGVYFVHIARANIGPQLLEGRKGFVQLFAFCRAGVAVNQGVIGTYRGKVESVAPHDCGCKRCCGLGWALTGCFAAQRDEKQKIVRQPLRHFTGALLQQVVLDSRARQQALDRIIEWQRLCRQDLQKTRGHLPENPFPGMEAVLPGLSSVRGQLRRALLATTAEQLQHAFEKKRGIFRERYGLRRGAVIRFQPLPGVVPQVRRVNAVQPCQFSDFAINGKQSDGVIRTSPENACQIVDH